MGHIREPEGIDFAVDPRPLRDWEKLQIREVITYYKKTGKIKKIVPLKKNRKKVTAD